MSTILSVENLCKNFPVNKGFLGTKSFVHAVNDISFTVKEGETFSLVGESGCGKSTTGRLINRLITPNSGKIIFNDNDITHLTPNEMRPLRSDMQMIFQDPNASLNPRMRVEELVSEPLLVHTNLSLEERLKKAHELLNIVGLSSKHAKRYPHEFSGGQRQRIGIARALTVNPKLIIADEPVSSLDVSIQAQVLNLMQHLQKEFKLTYLFISHDLSVVEMISDKIAVMYLGTIVETSKKADLYNKPLHPYTQALLSAVPVPDPTKEIKRILLTGDIPSAVNPPSGCLFHTRCPHCMDKCRTERPVIKDVGNEHFVACHLV